MNEPNQILNLPVLAKMLADEIVTLLKLRVNMTSIENGDEDKAYTIQELADRNKVHPDTIRKFLRIGKLRSIRNLRHHRIPAKEWRRFIDQNLGVWESTWSEETVENVMNKRKENQ